jgi:hypothetical protein
MPRTVYCWRCRMDLPMLTDDEYERLSPHLSNAIREIQSYRQQHGCSLAEARANAYGARALEIYRDLTGFQETNVDALFHHRLSVYGPPCHACGKLLRTPQARWCAECGAERAQAQGPQP